MKETSHYYQYILGWAEKFLHKSAPLESCLLSKKHVFYLEEVAALNIHLANKLYILKRASYPPETIKNRYLLFPIVLTIVWA